jgi:hypothetical protein
MPEESISIVEDRGSVALSQGFTLTPTGCTVEGQPSIDAYGEALARCGRLANASQWALGDLIVYGEGRGDWGEMYTQFVELSSRSYAQISQAARVSKTFPPGDMREYAAHLSWSHHRALLSIDRGERLGLLRQAQENEWNVETLKQAANDLASLTNGDGPASTQDGDPLVEVLADPAVNVTVACISDESATALRRWCQQFPSEYTCA